MIERTCLQCSKTFYTHQCQINRGGGKFCCIGCGTRYRNLHNNPTRDPKVREKISKNHADVSGKNNPMYGVRGKNAPSYIDGRNSYTGETYRKMLLASGKEQKCIICGATDNLHVHHKDGNHNNNDINNLVWLCSKCHHDVHVRKRDELGRFTNEKAELREVS